ncbi:hypothetical protein R3W88_026711 [Solanum pinnatisectum]|uniref:Uncharacterized protein n=1 Tax=Solanum pinnatisectum TaxID=50273 RepID=A0AAV9LF62_9SOLN|nr:hypothetical protein R3W88_026711 [Solanum pinnatisectum]
MEVTLKDYSQQHATLHHDKKLPMMTSQPQYSSSAGVSSSSTPSSSREPELLHEPFALSTPVGESIIARRVYYGCLVTIYARIPVPPMPLPLAQVVEEVPPVQAVARKQVPLAHKPKASSRGAPRTVVHSTSRGPSRGP